MPAIDHLRPEGPLQETAQDASPGTAARSQSAQPRNPEGGYALLAILLGAVMLSILLVKALPREAMSAQRIREERLIDRGEEYARAIELYFREHQKYPQELDDLEDTNGVRYLRKRYKDPMTGEDEWRLIHIGADGRFKDSLVYDTEDPEEMMSADGRMGAGGSGFSGSGIGGSGFGNQQRRSSFGNRGNQNQRMDANTYQALYGTPPPAQPGVFQGAGRARQVRESAAPDNPLQRQNNQFGMDEGQAPPGDANNPENAGLGPDGRPLPPEQQQPTDYSNLPPGQVPPEAGQRPQPGQQTPQGYPVQPTGGIGYSLPQSRGSIAQRNRQNQRGGFAQQQQQTGGPVGPIGMQGVSPDAASVIGRLLTTPRPGGLAGIQGQAGAAMQQGQQGAAFQEGIAGVASKSEELGAVKVYKGMETYREWEFVYDYRQDTGMGGMPGGLGQMGNINPNQPGLSGGGGLTGNPGAFGQIPGLPGQVPAGTAPPQGPDPRQTQFGGRSTTPNLPPTMPAPAPAPDPPDPNDGNRQPASPDGSTPSDPNQPPAPPPATPAPEDPNRGRTYQLPPSRSTRPR